MANAAAPARPVSSEWAWVSWVNVLVGIWEFFAPWIWGYALFSPAALWNAVIFGLLIFAFALWSSFSLYSWPSWWNVLFGVWLLMSPLILGYRLLAPLATVNDIVVGIVVITFAMITAFAKPGLGTATTTSEEGQAGAFPVGGADATRPTEGVYQVAAEDINEPEPPRTATESPRDDGTDHAR